MLLRVNAPAGFRPHGAQYEYARLEDTDKDHDGEHYQ